MKPEPTLGDDEVLRRLESHAAELRTESYPGDLLEDVRARLGSPGRRRAASGAPLLAATAASVLLVVWMFVETAPPRTVAVTSPSAAEAPGSPGGPAPSPRGQGLARLPAPPRLSGAPTVPAAPSLGRAFTIGAGALARVRAPAAPSPPRRVSKEE